MTIQDYVNIIDSTPTYLLAIGLVAVTYVLVKVCKWIRMMEN